MLSKHTWNIPDLLPFDKFRFVMKKATHSGLRASLSVSEYAQIKKSLVMRLSGFINYLELFHAFPKKWSTFWKIRPTKLAFKSFCQCEASSIFGGLFCRLHKERWKHFSGPAISRPYRLQDLNSTKHRLFLLTRHDMSSRAADLDRRLTHEVIIFCCHLNLAFCHLFFQTRRHWCIAAKVLTHLTSRFLSQQRRFEWRFRVNFLPSFAAGFCLCVCWQQVAQPSAT